MAGGDRRRDVARKKREGEAVRRASCVDAGTCTLTDGESLFMAPNYHYIRAQLFKLQLFHLLVICTRAQSAVTFPVQAVTRAERGRAGARACDTARFHTCCREKIYSFL